MTFELLLCLVQTVLIHARMSQSSWETCSDSEPDPALLPPLQKNTTFPPMRFYSASSVLVVQNEKGGKKMFSYDSARKLPSTCLHMYSTQYKRLLLVLLRNLYCRRRDGSVTVKTGRTDSGFGLRTPLMQKRYEKSGCQHERSWNPDEKRAGERKWEHIMFYIYTNPNSSCVFVLQDASPSKGRAVQPDE